MRTTLYAIAAVILLWLFVTLKPAEAAKPDELPIKVGVQCGSLIGEGVILVLFAGQVFAFEVECGGPKV